MKLIDILNKKVNGELKFGFSFAYDGYVWEYCIDNRISNKYNENLGKLYNVEMILNDKIYVIEK